MICYNFEVEGIFYDFVACVLCIYLVVGGKKFIDDLIKINRIERRGKNNVENSRADGNKSN